MERLPTAESAPPVPSEGSQPISAARPRKLSAGAPPWLWVWAALQVLALPASWSGLQNYLHMYVSDLWNASPAVHVLYLFSAGVDWFVPLCLAGGIVLVFLPWLRAAYIERRNGLTAAPEDGEWAQEVRAFLAEHAPRLEIRANLLRPGQLCFVYPSGYGQARLALFGAFIRLWRSDRSAAQTVLLHEIEHYRRGDNLILGAGSFFEGGVRLSLVFLLCVVIVMTAVIRLAGSHYQIDYVSFVSSMVIQILQPFVIPILCIWIAEFNADRFASDSAGSPEGVLRVLGSLRQKQPLLKSIISRLTHPPVWLRRFMVGLSDGRWLGTVYALIFSGLAATTLFHWAWVSLLGRTGTPVTMTLDDAWRSFLTDNFDWFVAMAALAVAWPLLARVWDSLFARTRAPSYGWPMRTAASWCVILLLFAACTVHTRRVVAAQIAQASADAPQEILGVWQLQANSQTYIEFQNDGTYILLSKMSDGFAAGIGTYRFAGDNSHVELTSSVLVNGTGILAPHPNYDQIATVDVDPDQLRLVFDADTPEQDWSRVVDGTDPNAMIHTQGAQAYEPGASSQSGSQPPASQDSDSSDNSGDQAAGASSDQNATASSSPTTPDNSADQAWTTQPQSNGPDQGASPSTQPAQPTAPASSDNSQSNTSQDQYDYSGQ